MGIRVSRHDVGHEPLVPRPVRTHHDRCLSHRRMSGHDRPHLTWLDPEPPDLHLLVSPPGEHQLPGRGPPHPIPGPVHPLTRHPERAGHEPLRRQPGPAHIAPSHLRTGHVQLPDHTDRYRRQELVKHVGPRVGHRSADGDLPGVQVACVKAPGHHPDRGFGGSVVVEHRHVPSRPHKVPGPGRRRRLTAEHQRPPRQHTGKP